MDDPGTQIRNDALVLKRGQQWENLHLQRDAQVFILKDRVKADDVELFRDTERNLSNTQRHTDHYFKDPRDQLDGNTNDGPTHIAATLSTSGFLLLQSLQTFQPHRKMKKRDLTAGGLHQQLRSFNVQDV